MARPLRIHVPGAWYHVTARGNERREIVWDDRDRRRFVECLANMVERYRVRIHAYVLMDNHYHLILETPEGNLSRAMQWFNVSYSAWFNRRRRRSGHLFQGRFKAAVVDPAEWGVELSRYVHLNPVRTTRHGMGCKQRNERTTSKRKAPSPIEVRERLAVLNGYRWSSYRAYAGLEPTPAWLHTASIAALTGGGPAQWRRRYLTIVEPGIREGVNADSSLLWETVRSQTVVGTGKFVGMVRELTRQGEKRPASREHAGKREIRRRRKIEQAIAIVSRARGEKWDAFKARKADHGREMVWWLARRHCGMTLRELGQATSGEDYAAVGMALARFESKLKTNASLRRSVGKLEKELLNVET